MCRSSWRCAGSHDSDSSSPAHQLALRDSGRLRDSRVRNSGIRAWRAETRARQARRASRAWRRSSGPGRSHSFEQPQVVDPEHAIGRPTAGTAPFRDSITFAIFAYRQPPPVRGADQRVVGGRCWCASSAACADALVRIIAALLFRHRWASSSPCKARARAPSRFVTSRHRWLAKSAKNAGRVSLAIGPRVDGEGPIAPLLPATQSNATVAIVLSFGVRQVGEKLGNDSGIGWVRGHESSPMFVQVGK